MSWFAKIDKPIYVTDGRTPRNRVGRLIATVIGCLAMSLAWALVPDGAVKAWLAALVLVGLVGFLAWYIVWRRARNRRLTGSATTWPDEDL